MTYEEIKAKAIELKPKFVLLVCFALVFLIGFGTGRYSQTEANPKGSSLQADYNTDKPVIEAETGDKQADVKGDNIEAPDQAQAGQGCIVKGNISAKGARI
jgi:hypothetical protein